jgi:hypothetical protein
LEWGHRQKTSVRCGWGLPWALYECNDWEISTMYIDYVIGWIDGYILYKIIGNLIDFDLGSPIIIIYWYNYKRMKEYFKYCSVEELREEIRNRFAGVRVKMDRVSPSISQISEGTRTD